MALQRSTDIQETSYEHPQHDRSEIEMSHITGNIYDTLEGRDRDSHLYSTTREAVAAVKTGTHNIENKVQSDDTAKRDAFSSRKVELTMWQLAVAMVSVFALICTMSGFIIYHVVNARIADIEMHTLQNHGAVEEKHSDIDRRLVAVETKQNTSELATLDHYASIDQRLETLDNAIETVQNKQNISDQQVAFTAHMATGTAVDTVLTFRNVDLNVGDGYNRTTGRFRCPLAGTYLFSATMISVKIRSSSTNCWIRKNAENAALVLSREGAYDSASVSILFHLSVGDFVDFGNCHNANYIATFAGHTSFIGYLIQAN